MSKAYKAGRIIKQATCEQKNNALLTAASTIRLSAEKILEANSLDMKLASQKGLKKSLIDRLYIGDDRLEGVALGLKM